MSAATTTPALPIPHRKSRIKAGTRKLRELGIVGHALASTHHVVMAQIVPMRFCNLSCAYCNEYDKVSEPVPLDEMLRRIDHLARLGTSIITISGGEPLTHPDLDQIIARIRHHGRLAGMITNGYFLMPERIERLNRAGLDHMQISIDNVQPDEISKKSLKVLDKKLQFLAEYAEFHVNINSVVGGGIKNPQDALTIGHRALELGFTSTIGIIHDGSGQLKPLGGEERRVYYEMKQLDKKNYSRFNHFQEAIANGEPNDWRCRAGVTLHLRLRRRAGALLLAAARLPRRPAGQLHPGRPRPRIPHREDLRAQLHRLLRPPDLLHRPLASPAGQNDQPQRRPHRPHLGPDQYRALRRRLDQTCGCKLRACAENNLSAIRQDGHARRS